MVHLTPDYLFFKGISRDLGMTTGRQGIISWLDSLAFILGLWGILQVCYKKTILPQIKTLVFISFLFINILIGLLPSIVTALEIQGSGNNLRSIQSWPFAMIATGFIIHKMTSRVTCGWLPSFLTAATFSVVFLSQYFTSYKEESVWIFRRWSLEEAKTATTDQDWMKFLYRHQDDRFASRYFLMRYHGDSCLQAKNVQEKLNLAFKKMRQQNQNKKN